MFHVKHWKWEMKIKTDFLVIGSGIAAFSGTDDCYETYVKDTLDAGDVLSDEEKVRFVIKIIQLE